jgi:hypothetical protein
MVTIRTESGNELSFTPNHPMLTLGGWIAGGLLKEGDYVISGSFGQDATAAIHPDGYNVPARIEEIAESFSMVLGEMPTAAPDFHGDGVGSQVHVVRTNGLLGNGLDAALCQPLFQQKLGRRLIADLVLSGLCNLAAVSKRLALAANGIMCSFGAATMLLRRRLLGPELIGYCLAANGDSCMNEPGSYHIPRDTKGFGQAVLGFLSKIASDNLIHGNRVHGAPGATRPIASQSVAGNSIPEQPAGLEHIREMLVRSVESPGHSLNAVAGNVVPDRILEVNVSAFSGHVYSLQTQEQWYVANGIIAHNCTMIPICEGVDPPQWTAGGDWFAEQDEETQRHILGPGRYELWENGQVSDFRDFATHTQNETWGGAVVPTSLSVLR